MTMYIQGLFHGEKESVNDLSM